MLEFITLATMAERHANALGGENRCLFWEGSGAVVVVAMPLSEGSSLMWGGVRLGRRAKVASKKAGQTLRPSVEFPVFDCGATAVRKPDGIYRDYCAMARNKIATCQLRYAQGKPPMLNNAQGGNYRVEKGLSPLAGATYLKILSNGKDDCLVFVAVSGAQKSEDDLRIAHEIAKRATKEWCSSAPNGGDKIAIEDPLEPETEDENTNIDGK